MRSLQRFWLPLFLMLVMAPVQAQPTQQLMQQQAVDWNRLLQVAGVNDVLDQADAMIKQEMANLQNAPLGFDKLELKQLRHRFDARLGSAQLKQAVVADLKRRISPDQARKLAAVLNSPRYRFLQSLQTQLADPNVREDMRAYKVQVKDQAPNPSRVSLLENLNTSLEQSTLEADLKVALRKQLLITVSEMKTRETYSDAMLDQQLAGYRQEVKENISQNALYAYLYLYKHTPSDQVQDLVTSLHSPSYEKFMHVCRDAIRASFELARQQLRQDLRVAAK